MYSTSFVGPSSSLSHSSSSASLICHNLNACMALSLLTEATVALLFMHHFQWLQTIQCLIAHNALYSCTYPTLSGKAPTVNITVVLYSTQICSVTADLYCSSLLLRGVVPLVQLMCLLSTSTSTTCRRQLLRNNLLLKSIYLILIYSILRLLFSLKSQCSWRAWPCR